MTSISTEQEYLQQLNRERKAHAVLQDGIILLANDRFLTCLGYESNTDIEAFNLLDLTVRLEKGDLRYFLKLAARVEKHDKDLPKLPVILKKADGTTISAELCAYRSTLDDEEVIEVTLLTLEDLKLGNRVRNLPWKLYACFLCIVLLIILLGAILPKLNINNSPSTFLPADAPSVTLNDQVREIFPDDEVIVLLFEGVALFSDGFIEAYDKLTQSLLDHASIDDVISITRQDHISGSAEGFMIEPLINVDELDQTHPRQRLARSINDRFARSSLVAADGSAVAMVVIPKPLNNSILNLGLEQDVLAQVKEHQLQGYLTAMAGEITTDVAQMRAILHDNMIFIPATVIVGLILTWVLFHRLIAVIVTGVVTGAVVCSTIAFYVLFQYPFNSISSIIPPLLSALTIAGLVHFYNALYYASRRGLSGEKRVQAALQEIKRPALFSTLTTSVGLASLGLSPIPPVSMFGLTSAVGVFLPYIIVIHMLPPIFTHYDNRTWPSRRSNLAFLDKLLTKLFHLGVRRPIWIIGIILIGLLLTAPNIAKVQVETNLQEFFPQSHSLRKETRHIEEKLVGTTPMEVVFTSSESEGLIQPAQLHFIRDFQTWLETLDSVDKTLSIADFVEEMHWGFNAENPALRIIPDNADLISQYLFIYDGEDIYDFIDREFQTARIAMNVNVHGANEISTLMKQIEQHLETGMPGDLQWKITGAGRLFADQEDLLIEGQVKSLGGAIILIFGLMLLLWRSLKDASICMIPNLSPIILIFISMGLFAINLDMATAMIASVAVGIAIDDTIHIYHGFIHRVRKGISPVLAMARTYQQAGRAVMTTTLILCAQFLLLLGSTFVPMGHFGILASIGLVAALLFDLLLLPAILILVFKNKTLTSQEERQLPTA